MFMLSSDNMQYLYSFWLLQSGERESCNMFILLVLNEPSLPAPPGLQLQRLANKCMRSDLIRYKPVPVLLGSKISFLPPTKTDQSRNSVYSKGKGSKQCADMLACGSFRDAFKSLIPDGPCPARFMLISEGGGTMCRSLCC